MEKNRKKQELIKEQKAKEAEEAARAKEFRDIQKDKKRKEFFVGEPWRGTGAPADRGVLDKITSQTIPLDFPLDTWTMEPAGKMPQPTRSQSLRRVRHSPRKPVPVEGVRTYQGAPTYFGIADEAIFGYDKDGSADVEEGNTEFDRLFKGCAGLSSKHQLEDELDEMFTDQRSRGTKMFHDAYQRTLQQLIGDQPMDCTLKFSEDHMKRLEGMAGLTTKEDNERQRHGVNRRHYQGRIERSASAPSVGIFRDDGKRHFPNADQGLRDC